MGQAAFPGRGIRTGKGDARPDARPASLGPVVPGRLDAAGRGRSAGARVVGPVVEGEVPLKAAGKVMAIDFRLPWKEAGGKFQYGLNMPDGVNMVVLIIHDNREP